MKTRGGGADVDGGTDLVRMLEVRTIWSIKIPAFAEGLGQAIKKLSSS